jgi:hypothetical protein
MSTHLPTFLIVAIDIVDSNGHRPICTLFEREKAVELREALDRERDEFYRRRALLEERWDIQQAVQEVEEQASQVVAALGALSPQQTAAVLSTLTPQQVAAFQQVLNDVAVQQATLPADGIVGPATAAQAGIPFPNAVVPPAEQPLVADDPPPDTQSISFVDEPPVPTNPNELFWDSTNSRLGIGGSSPSRQLTDGERAEVMALVQELDMTDPGWLTWPERPHGPFYELWETSDDPSRKNILMHDGTTIVDPRVVDPRMSLPA